MPFEQEPPVNPGQRGVIRDDGERWAALMLLAQDGDGASYHVLLQEVTPYLRSIARRHLGGGEDVEDAVQDILLIVHGIRHTFERGRPFKPWLGTIASRRCIDLLRRRAHRLRHEVEAHRDFADVEHGQHGPDEAASRVQAARTVHAALATLPDRQRDAIRLLRLGELSPREAAARSRQTPGSLKVACHRALKSLARALAIKDTR
ncbi:MAG: sigma-70 family RNA polymerase sigma factor [Gammaproteobacteria bacterium]|nr:sigma-70 family RNA polymerase sigma factor [Gammaproteobacteria bacterium]